VKWCGHFVSVLHKWVKCRLCTYLLLFVYICSADGNPIISKRGLWFYQTGYVCHIFVFFWWLMVKLKPGGELRCSGRVCDSCTTSGTDYFFLNGWYLRKLFGRTYEKILLRVCYGIYFACVSTIVLLDFGQCCKCMCYFMI